MGRQLPDVNSKYGAPMGRRESNIKPTGRTVRLFRVRLNSGGYDDGGAYWGIGEPLYCATDGAAYLRFIRANDRRHAADRLDISAQLIRR